MVTIPFALSVHHFISSVGADAGFAAFIAVALLVLLFFSQARETANLRRRADEASQRVQQLEGQLYALSEQLAALPAEISVVRAGSPRAAPAHAGVAATAGAGSPATTLPPAAPAGVGAPALAAATRLIPDPLRPFGEHQPATVGLVDGATDEAPKVHPSPVIVGGNGASHRPVAAPVVQQSVQARPGGPSRPGGGPPRGAQGRPVGGPGRLGGPPRSPMAITHGQRRTGVGKVFMVLAVLLVVGAVVGGVIVIINVNHGASRSRSSAAQARSTLASHRTAHTVVIKPSTVTVSVLNGTDQSGLAGRVSSRLLAVGFKKGAVTNAADQTHTKTVVQYMPQARLDALAVATSLKLGQTSVQPVDQATRQIACPPASGPCTSAVVVTVGSDLASLATH